MSKLANKKKKIIKKFYWGLFKKKRKMSTSPPPPPPPLDPNIKCPICMDLMINPRIYPCGHTVCSPCMAEMDARVNSSRTVFEMPVYRCPTCRNPDFTFWSNRPRNHQIMPSIEAHPTYHEVVASKDMSKYTKISSDDFSNTNLSQIAADSHANNTIRMYESLLPRLVEAARIGQLKVEITENIPVLQRCVHSLSSLLFKRNNIYKITCNRRECVIFLLPMIERYSNTCTNPDFYSADGNDIDVIDLTTDVLSNASTTDIATEVTSEITNTWQPPPANSSETRRTVRQLRHSRQRIV